MDYIGIIRQSFDLSWKYKLLWSFGFFASFLGGWSQIFKPEYRAQAADFLGSHPILIVIIAIYTLILLLFFIAMNLITVAGLIDGVVKITGGHSVSLKELFKAGFRHIRYFSGLWLILVAASLVLALLFITISVVPYILAGAWGLLILPITIPLAATVVFSIISIYSLAQREIVIGRKDLFDSIGGAYNLLLSYPGQNIVIFLISMLLFMLLFILNSFLFAVFSVPLALALSHSELTLALLLFIEVPIFIAAAIAISGFFGTILNSIYTMFYMELKKIPTPAKQ